MKRQSTALARTDAPALQRREEVTLPWPPELQSHMASFLYWHILELPDETLTSILLAAAAERRITIDIDAAMERVKQFRRQCVINRGQEIAGVS